MTREELQGKYRSRIDELGSLRAQVDGVAVYTEILHDLESLWGAEDDSLVGLEQAASESGYSSDHLRRLAREGKLPSARRGRRLAGRARDDQQNRGREEQRSPCHGLPPDGRKVILPFE